MAPRLPPPPTPKIEPSDLNRMLESVLQALQQQNAALVHQNTITLQNLEAARVSAENARVSSENTKRQFMEVLTSGRATLGASSFAIPVQEWSLESFLQHHPARFTGKCSPDEADHWFRDMERIYEAKGCPDERKLAYTQYLLTGEAGHWWSSMKMILERSKTPITWELFRVKFYTEYFPNSVRFAKEVEFLELVQGNRSVSEYADRFKHLLRFNTMAVDEEWQCRKFENGLRSDIKLLVKRLRIREFPALVEMARDLEKTKRESEGQQSQPARSGGSSGSRGGLSTRKAPYTRPSLSSGFRGSSSQPLVQSGPTRPSGTVRCFGCGGPHYRNNCPMGSVARKCFKCVKEGHIAAECTSTAESGPQAQRTRLPPPRGGGRPQAVDKVYAMTGSEAVSSAKMESDALACGDKLVLRGLSFHGFHGAKPEERKLGQKFVVDIDAWMDLATAGKTDHLSDTVSYTAIYDIVKEVLEGSPHNLLESVAQKIAITTLTNHKEIFAVRVKVEKPHVAVQGPVDYLGVEIHRRRSDLSG